MTSTSATKWKPRRETVRMTLWDLPSSPIALRAALIRLSTLASVTQRPFQTAAIEFVPADDPMAILDKKQQSAAPEA